MNMGLTVVIGGQFGSEGKGKVALHFSRELGVKYSVKVGGTNAGHTVIAPNGKAMVFRVLPAAMVLPTTMCVLAAGCYFDPSILFKEMQALDLEPARVLIHPNAGIITEECKSKERASGLVEAIASTGSGTGYATYKRIMRDNFVRACDLSELSSFICDTSVSLRKALASDEEILIEGTQGYGLSLLHTPYYPCCTSRDTTATSFVAESGLSPLDVTRIVMVLRTYPIRVGGNSGPLPREVDWDYVTREARSKTPIIEHTSVTHHVRRVAKFDPDIVRQANRVNLPNIVVLNFLDYIWDVEPEVIGVNRRNFIDQVQETTGVKITHVGFGPDSVVPI